MDRNALDWLFSTAPQALAALVGLIFTGVSFIISAIDKEIARDNTRENICLEMKKEIHYYMRILFILAGISVSLDLLVIIFNPIEDGRIISRDGAFDWYLLLASVLLILNLVALIFSLYFVIKVASPGYFDETVKRLSKAVNKGTIDAKQFVLKYIDFEKALRDIPYLDGTRNGRVATVLELTNELKYRELLDGEDFNKIKRLNGLRNLIVHGEDIKNVSSKDYQDVIAYTRQMQDLSKLEGNS